jgi:hypothetical protein
LKVEIASEPVKIGVGAAISDGNVVEYVGSTDTCLADESTTDGTPLFEITDDKVLEEKAVETSK